MLAVSTSMLLTSVLTLPTLANSCHDGSYAHLLQLLSFACVTCSIMSRSCRCARKWRDRYVESKAITQQQVDRYDQGWCPRCLGICACSKCLNKAAPAVGGAAPVFSSKQEKAFALHMLAVLRPHIADFTAARDAEASFCSACPDMCKCKVISVMTALQVRRVHCCYTDTSAQLVS